MKLIKRYKNRRLYDTELKKTIKLEDIKRYADEGIEIKVIDNADGKDITVQTMVMVLSSTAKDEDSLEENRSILKKLWTGKGADVMDAMKKLTLAAIGVVNLSREKAEEIFDELVKKGEMTKNEKAEAMKKMADKFEESAGKVKDAVEQKVNAAMEKINVNSRINELNKKVDELTSKLEELSKKMTSEE